MAFIVDIRRGNLQLHLMYKALFEMSSDRADFVSRLFSMKRPAGLRRESTVQNIFTAFADAGPAEPGDLQAEPEAIKRLYVRRTGSGSSEEDLKGIEGIYQTFYHPRAGHSLRGRLREAPAPFPTYAELMVATDDDAVPRGYLATEENFARIKDLHSRNLIVPVVGNFAGPKAIRAVGQYLKARGAVVAAFYVSNVEQYLIREGGLDEFCAMRRIAPARRLEHVHQERTRRAPVARRRWLPTRRLRREFQLQAPDMLGVLKGCTR